MSPDPAHRWDAPVKKYQMVSLLTKDSPVLRGQRKEFDEHTVLKQTPNKMSGRSRMGHTIERVALAPSHSRSSLLGGRTGHPNNNNIITLVGGRRRISTKTWQQPQ